MRYRYLLFICVISVFSCKSVKTGNYVPRNDWKLVWSEEFDSDWHLDESKWAKIPRKESDWGNYMTDDESCYEIKDGNLILKGIVNTDRTLDTVPYLTGGIETKGKFSFQYGKIELRVKLENATGAWPAIWMLADQPKYGKYPRNGEIDIMEHLNYDDFIYQTIHSYYTLELKQKENPEYFGKAKMKTGDYNVFGLEWYPDMMVFTLNGKVTFVYPKIKGVDKSQWPFDQPFYLKIDMQLGGSWVGEVDPNDLPVQMIVDWVRVYK